MRLNYWLFNAHTVSGHDYCLQYEFVCLNELLIICLQVAPIPTAEGIELVEEDDDDDDDDEVDEVSRLSNSELRTAPTENVTKQSVVAVGGTSAAGKAPVIPSSGK